MKNEHWFSFFTSAVLSLLTFAFGPDAMLIRVLFFLMIMDYITGMMASIATGKGLCSSFGFRGLFKKFIVICIIAVTHQIDILLNTSVAMLGALYFYCGLELISIVENSGKLGVPMPKTVRQAIALLKEKEVFHESNVESQVHRHEVSSDKTE